MPTKRNQDLLDLLHSADKKVSKPLMEKRRRARINHSLAQLKALVIDPNTTEKSRQAKLEKADILELTVQHLHEIQRQQRTALLLDTRHPKKKFEIGYSECAREVDLFLSNLIDPQSPGLDSELQRRLKDHLLKRLNDFKSINPVSDPSTTETIGDTCQEEPLPLLSPATSSKDDSPLSMDVEETDSSGMSPLKKMLTYYSDQDVTKENPEEKYISNRVPSKYPKDVHRIDSKEDNGLPFSCQSVSSTTGFRSARSPFQQMKPEDHFENIQVQNGTNELVTADISHLPETQTVFKKVSPRIVGGSADIPRQVPSPVSNIPPGHSSRGQNRKIIEQIPLVPRQLANGDWALVLPASLVPNNEEESHPISAFRLVLPSHPSPADSDCEHVKLRKSSSSPLSSTVSDLSAEEYCARFENDSVERREHSSPDSTQFVWRPW